MGENKFREWLEANRGRIPYPLQKSIGDRLISNPDLPSRWEDLEVLLREHNPNPEEAINAVKDLWEEFIEKHKP